MIRPIAIYCKYLYYFFFCGTPQKFFNFILNKLETKLKKVRLSSMPINITIGVSEICNLNCPGCPTGAKIGGSTERKLLSFEQFKYIFDQVKKYVLNINLFFLGESFLNKEIFLMIGYATANRCGVTIHSNFNIFNEEMAEKAIKNKLTHISLSIDGVTQEVYEKYRKGGNLANVFKNIEILVKKKRDMKSLLPFLTWQFLYFPHNVHEIGLARQKAKELGVNSFESFPGNLDNIGKFGILKNYNLFNGKLDIITANFCNDLWGSLLVHSDGSVVPCCHGFRKKDVFDNVFEKSLKEIRNNNDFMSLRKMIRTGRIGESVRYPCAECRVINNLRSHS
jgi:radical SAM protein with 4Fe4S-binding SPASM domain